MLVAYRLGDRAVFLYGLAKNGKDNIDPDELLTLREIAAGWLAADAALIAEAPARDVLQEVKNDG